jgi:hypothetical protein
MDKFLHKKEWSPDDWEIFYSNINILISSNGLKKGEFSDKIGVKNFFRKDRKRVSRLVLNSICEKFNVTKEWLATDRRPKDYKLFLSHSSDDKIMLPDHEYKLHGDPPHYSLEELTGIPAELNMNQAFKLLMEIYEKGDRPTIRKTVDALRSMKVLADKRTSDDHSVDDKDRIDHIENKLELLEHYLENILEVVHIDPDGKIIELKKKK